MCRISTVCKLSPGVRKHWKDQMQHEFAFSSHFAAHINSINSFSNAAIYIDNANNWFLSSALSISAEGGQEGRKTKRGRKGEMDTCYLQQVDCHL